MEKGEWEVNRRDYADGKDWREEEERNKRLREDKKSDKGWKKQIQLDPDYPGEIVLV